MKIVIILQIWNKKVSLFVNLENKKNMKYVQKCFFAQVN